MINRPFADLACELRNNEPVCPDGGDEPDRGCDERCQGSTIVTCGAECHNLCHEGIRRMAAVFEAAREVHASLRPVNLSWLPVAEALNAANASMEV